MNRIINASRWFYLFIGIHLTVWTLAPFFTRFTLPMDSIEGAIWGHQLTWGYDKNPFMNALVSAIAVKLGDTSSLFFYFFCQLSVVICFWCVWQLGKKIVPPLYALLAVMLLEGMQYYNLHAIDLNDNTLELSLWALTILFFYQALTEKTKRDWILTGIFAALGMMTKYYTAVLLLPMLLFMIVNKDAREHFKQPGIYCSFIIFLLLISPHLYWLTQHNFITINYALNRVSSAPSWQNHFLFPESFAVQQLAVMVPSLFLILLLWAGKNTSYTFNYFSIQSIFFAGSGFWSSFINCLAVYRSGH